MKVFLETVSKKYNATGNYDAHTNHITVLKGSTINTDCTITKGKRKRNKICQEYVSDSILTKDIDFKSPSTAATFVSGTSMNGYLRWKNEKGENLRTVRERING